MKIHRFSLFFLLQIVVFSSISTYVFGQEHIRKTWYDTYRHNERLGRHYINCDSMGDLVSWLPPETGHQFDYILESLWDFWDNIPYAYDGVKYYMMHRQWPFSKKYTGIWGGTEDHGIGGDQVQMLLNSWIKLYAYTGYEEIIDNMVYMADFYLAKSLSPSDAKWPNIPYPWHSSLESGFVYDGDMIDGINVTQIDKAGDLGYQLVNLYKITGYKRYLNVAVNVANTLSKYCSDGDVDNSPLPYKVNTVTGEIKWKYTGNWIWTIRLFEELILLNTGDIKNYKACAKTLRLWLKNVALKNDKYGPFFEDISDWSNCGINAGRLAEYILLNPEKWGNSWQKDSRKALDWIWNELGNHVWDKYGVTVINEQTLYPYPGNSHTSRYAYLELLYSQKTGDWSRKVNSVRQLIWATYSVDTEGRNEYPGDPVNNEIWFTDGYGDYVAHYINAMAVLPDLADQNKNRLLRTSSVITNIQYTDNHIIFETYDSFGQEILRLKTRPINIKLNNGVLNETADKNKEGWYWEETENGGVLYLNRKKGNDVEIIF